MRPLLVHHILHNCLLSMLIQHIESCDTALYPTSVSLFIEIVDEQHYGKFEQKQIMPSCTWDRLYFSRIRQHIELLCLEQNTEF